MAELGGVWWECDKCGERILVPLSAGPATTTATMMKVDVVPDLTEVRKHWAFHEQG